MADRRRKARRKPEQHPAWKLAQTAVAAVGLAIFAVHVGDGGHLSEAAKSGIDAVDATGVVGLGLAGKLAYQLVRDVFRP